MVKNREVFFDSLKGILIVSVVFGHFIQIQHTNQIIRSAIFLIYSFHMPAFVFVSGYFSKKAKLTDEYILKQVKNILIPSILFHVLYWLIAQRDIHTLFDFGEAFWYLLSLFVWRISLFPLTKIKSLFACSVIACLLLGFSKADNFLAISRTISFAPFFFAGYYCKDVLVQFARKTNKTILLLSFVFILAIYYMMYHNGFNLVSLYMYKSYDSAFGFDNSLITRIVVLILGFIYTFLLVGLAPSKPNIFSSIGKNTISIFIFHSFLVSFVRVFTPLGSINPVLFVVICILLTVFSCIIFGNKYITNVYLKITEKISSYIIS